MADSKTEIINNTLKYKLCAEAKQSRAAIKDWRRCQEMAKEHSQDIQDGEEASYKSNRSHPNIELYEEYQKIRHYHMQSCPKLKGIRLVLHNGTDIKGKVMQLGCGDAYNRYESVIIEHHDRNERIAVDLSDVLLASIYIIEQEG